MKRILRGIGRRDWVRKHDVLVLIEQLSRGMITYVAAVESVRTGMRTARIRAQLIVEKRK